MLASPKQVKSATNQPQAPKRSAVPTGLHFDCATHASSAKKPSATSSLNPDMTNYTHLKLCQYVPPPIDFWHYAMPMTHPITRESISSYIRLMNNPVTAQFWMTAFGKDF
jgi:hypothetical protein